jgi:hypothetical protein
MGNDQSTTSGGSVLAILAGDWICKTKEKQKT